jgi:hypothetical protein
VGLVNETSIQFVVFMGECGDIGRKPLQEGANCASRTSNHNESNVMMGDFSFLLCYIGIDAAKC